MLLQILSERALVINDCSLQLGTLKTELNMGTIYKGMNGV